MLVNGEKIAEPFIVKSVIVNLDIAPLESVEPLKILFENESFTTNCAFGTTLPSFFLKNKSINHWKVTFFFSIEFCSLSLKNIVLLFILVLIKNISVTFPVIISS